MSWQESKPGIFEGRSKALVTARFIRGLERRVQKVFRATSCRVLWAWKKFGVHSDGSGEFLRGLSQTVI